MGCRIAALTGLALFGAAALACAGLVVVGLFVEAPPDALPDPPAAVTSSPAPSPPDLPPLGIDYPPFAGPLQDLVPERVGRFSRTESRDAINLGDAQASWSAYYRADGGAEIHLRLRRFASPERAFHALLGEMAGAVTSRVTQSDWVERGGRKAGKLRTLRYHNAVKGVEAESVLWTQGNLAFVADSAAGLFAEEFRRAYLDTIPY